MNIIVIIILIIIVIGILFLIKQNITSNESFESTNSITHVDSDKCTLFSTFYLPYKNTLLNIYPDKYQYDIANFLFRLNWNVTVSNCAAIDTFPKPYGFDTVIRVKASSGRMYAYFLHSSTTKQIIIAFTGTAFEEEWKLNFDYRQIIPTYLNNAQSNTRVHVGFYSIYIQVRNKLLNLIDKYKNDTDYLIVTGLSLGGALATLAGFDYGKFNPILYTFAAPRVFNIVGAQQLDNMLTYNWRVFNTEDIIANLPLPITEYLDNETYYYEHSGTNVPFTSNLGSILANHSDSYEIFVLGTSAHHLY